MAPRMIDGTWFQSCQCHKSTCIPLTVTSGFYCLFHHWPSPQATAAFVATTAAAAAAVAAAARASKCSPGLLRPQSFVPGLSLLFFSFSFLLSCFCFGLFFFFYFFMLFVSVLSRCDRCCSCCSCCLHLLRSPVSSATQRDLSVWPERSSLCSFLTVGTVNNASITDT